MSTLPLPSLRALVFGLALAASATAVQAQTLTGSLSDDTTGPVTPGVHHVTGNIDVPTGKTLTIQAGAILKCNFGVNFILQGKLLAMGTTLNPVVITSIDDDTAGGDTNGNGAATLPSPGQWTGLIMNPGSGASVLDRVDIRYGGAGGWANVYVNAAGLSFTLKNSTVRNCSQPGLNAAGQASFVTVTNCTFTNNAGAAIENVRFDTLPGFTGNSGTGNGGNFLRVTNATMGVPMTLGPANHFNGCIVLASSPTISSPLTLNAGTVIKMQGGVTVVAASTLTVNGTTPAPVVFTSIDDDTVAGDTNGNGAATSPSPGQWTGLIFNGGSGASVIDRADIRYGGASGWANVYINAAGLAFQLKNSTLRNCSQPGLNAAGQDSLVTVSNCTFTNNTGAAIENVRFDRVSGYTGNSGAGNGGNFLRVTNATMAGPVTIGPANHFNGCIVLATSPTISSPLTLNAGTVIKMQGGVTCIATSTLTANGTTPSPVVFTTIDDDTVAGDTNGNGNATAPSPGQWAGLIFNPGSGASVLDHVDIRYGGAGGWANVYVNGAGLGFQLKNSTLRNGSAPGFNAASNVSNPIVTGCSFTNNAGAAVANLRLESVPGFTSNFASGNGINAMHISDATVNGNITIIDKNCLNGSLVIQNSFNVNPGGVLHVLSGVHFKMNNPIVVVSGAIDVQGSSPAPVVFTSYKDDSIDGDTNADGAANSPSGGDWPGILVVNGSAASTLSHVRIRYAGAGGWAGLTSNSSLLSAKNVRVERSSQQGFVLSALASGEDLTAWASDHEGFGLTGGAFTLKRCTAANGNSFGFFNNGAFGGTIRSSIAWGQATNFSGFAAGSVFFSDGSPTLAGSNGNINLDPKFLSAATGDLTLQKTSPCIDTGDPADFAFGTEDSGYPRWMDGNLNGSKVVDMGAYEFDHVHLNVSGAPVPGGTLTVTTTTTTPGLTMYMFIGIVLNEQQLKSFGPLVIDVIAPNVILPWAPSPSAIPLGIPAALPVPLPVIFQALGFQGPSANNPGNLSNPVFVTIN